MAESILDTIRDYAPVAGRHADNASLNGYRTEAKVWLSAMLKPRNRDVKKFLIIARARSGSTLLTELLNNHPDVICDREVLVKKVRFPVTYLENLARKSTARAYGAKLLSYQMVLVQDFRDPVGFLGQLRDRGYRFIHLTRDTFAQTVSLTRAQASGLYHMRDVKAVSEAAIDPAEFIRRLQWNAKLAEYEGHCLKDFNPLRIDYDTELMDGAAQQPTADRVFADLGLPSADVGARLKKVLPKDPRSALENYDDIARAVTEAGLAHLLPEA